MKNSMILLPFVMALTGCVPGADPLSQDGSSETDVLAAIQQKSEAVGARIGGPDGYGGMQMSTYMQHVPAQMGFSSTDDLASADGQMMIRFHNESTQACTFHLNYVSSLLGSEEQSADAEVDAGQVGTMQIPCSEVVGLGALDQPGVVGCHLADGQTIGNQMAVPGFLRMDYMCGDAFDMYLTPDANDLDGDGDTQEVILTSQSMQQHMGPNGPMGHVHASTQAGGMGMGRSIMGSPMMGN